MHPRVALVDPPQLETLEPRGFDLGTLVLGRKAKTAAALNRTPGFQSIFDVLRGDLRATARAHPLGRVTSIDGFRLFDEAWLSSDEMSFELTGVFNRIDRRPFYEGTCGEVRFLYRLRYETTQGGSPMSGRLPMTVNVVFLVDEADDPDCRRAAQAWMAPADLGGAAVIDWMLREGPLRPDMRKRWTLKSVETNLQTIRLQSSVHPTLAGHIEYGMRVFQPVAEQAERFAPAVMENMVDAKVLSRDPSLRAELLEHLRKPAVLEALDMGTLALPDRFLAKVAVSVSPRGLSRPANRPFRQVFEPSAFSDLDLGGYRTIRSPIALLRRLDGTSCTGCHQSRSIAGFHHVGLDSADAPQFNALLSGHSSHLSDDLERRRRYVSAIASGRAVDELRPIPERQGVGTGFGAPCGLGDRGLADWTCGEGLECKKLEDPEVGTCLIEGQIGSPCEYGSLLPGPRSHRDYVTGMARHECGPHQTCDLNVSGFALGVCGSHCDASLPEGTCGDFLDVDGFQSCLRAGGNLDDCADESVFSTGLRQCDKTHPCRQDYVCVRTSEAGVGACIPPYFVYQLRLDGYPLPR